MKKIKLTSIAVAALLTVAPVATTAVSSNSTTVEAAIHHKKAKKTVKKARRAKKRTKLTKKRTKLTKKVAKRENAVKRENVVKQAKKERDWKHTMFGDLSDLTPEQREKVMKGLASPGFYRTKVQQNLF